MAIIDFHCHLTEIGGYAALQSQGSLIDEPIRVVAVTNRPSDWNAMRRGNQPQTVSWALGLHPCLPMNDNVLGEFLRSAPDANAFGEIGLDYSPAATAKPGVQRRHLDQILTFPATRGTAISLHSRGAARDIVAAVRANQVRTAIYHWFLAEDPVIEESIDTDSYYSVNLAMVQSQRGRRVIQALPPNRLLLETDAPFGVGRHGAYGHQLLDRTIIELAALANREIPATRELIERNQTSYISRLSRVPNALQNVSASFGSLVTNDETREKQS
jgi:TatD DNase family protein